MTRLVKEDVEVCLKETFRVFSKDDDGCIPAAEIRYEIFPSLDTPCYYVYWFLVREGYWELYQTPFIVSEY